MVAEILPFPDDLGRQIRHWRRECAARGIDVDPSMPVDTDDHRRSAVAWLSRLVYAHDRGADG